MEGGWDYYLTTLQLIAILVIQDCYQLQRSGLILSVAVTDSNSGNPGLLSVAAERSYIERSRTLEHTWYTRFVFRCSGAVAKLGAIPSRIYTYEELYDSLKDKVLYQKQIGLYNKWIIELKKETFIEI